MKGIWAMGKSMMRSDFTSEAIWRPKQSQRIGLKKIWMFLQGTKFLPNVLNLLTHWSHEAIDPEKKITPPMAAAGLLGPELVFFFSHN